MGGGYQAWQKYVFAEKMYQANIFAEKMYKANIFAEKYVRGNLSQRANDNSENIRRFTW